MTDNHIIKLVATDLDGTFLRDDKSISSENLEALHALGRKGIQRVIATGRNLHKTLEVISSDVPFDYIVFSSGAGVYDCKNDVILHHRNLEQASVQQIAGYLVSLDLNFHLFKAVPENYKCWFHRGSIPCSEFESYLEYHKKYSEPFPADGSIKSDACQFLVVFPGNLDKFLHLKKEIEERFQEIKIVRASSPLQSGYIWMEIFHETVSKGNGVKFICDTLGIEHDFTIGIGNDYNDIDLLEFTRFSYLVENGPAELKASFRSAISNEESAFASVVNHFISGSLED
jgi:Cof subfamily protein (haloacid dehalogenase superfamily)